MAKYQKYAEYKDSGIEWLGDIPNHWAMSKLRYLFHFSKGLSITKENLQDEGIPCVNYGEVHSKYGFEVDPKKHSLKCVSENYLKTSENALLNNGDFVFADTSEDLKGSGNFTHLIGNEQIFAGYHTVIARPHNSLASRFYAYLFESKEFRSQIQLAVKGVKVFSITQAMLRSADAWLPSPDEQVKIANFLDHETAKIDSLIAKQEKLIELLKEKRQAVISHAVTKGLNPDVNMKDSGVEWLGQVPEHWRITPLKYQVETINGFGFSSNDFCDEGVPFIRAGNIKKKSITNVEIFLPQKVVNKYKRVILSSGDVVISMVGSDPTIKESAVGQVGIIPTDYEGAVPNQNIVILREKGCNLLKKYLFYSLCSTAYRTHLDIFSHKLANQAIISSSLIISAKFIMPSLEEQLEIISYLDKQLVMFDEMMLKAESAIQLMQERRTALISSAVTGKIDVRNWQYPNEAKTELSA